MSCKSDSASCDMGFKCQFTCAAFFYFLLQFHQNSSLLTIRDCFSFQKALIQKCLPHQPELCILIQFSLHFIGFHCGLCRICAHPFMASQIRSVSEEIMSYQMLPSNHRDTEISVHSLNSDRFGGVFPLIGCQVIFPKDGNTRPQSINSYCNILNTSKTLCFPLACHENFNLHTQHAGV